MTSDLEKAARAAGEASGVTWGGDFIQYRDEGDLMPPERFRAMVKAALLSLSEPSEEVVEKVAEVLMKEYGPEIGEGFTWYGLEEVFKPRHRDLARTAISTFLQAVVGEQ